VDEQVLISKFFYVPKVSTQKKTAKVIEFSDIQYEKIGLPQKTKQNKKPYIVYMDPPAHAFSISPGGGIRDKKERKEGERLKSKEKGGGKELDPPTTKKGRVKRSSRRHEKARKVAMCNKSLRWYVYACTNV